jgi:transglutaminase-like putative cysteine protease
MSFAACYKLTSYCLIASGFLALAMTGAVGLLPLLLFAAALAASWFLDTGRLRRTPPAWTFRAAALAYIPLYYVDFAFLSRSFTVSTLHLMLFVAALRLITSAADRAFLHLYLLSFAALLAAAALTMDLAFLFCLFLFLVSAVSALILFEMKLSCAAVQKQGMIQPVIVPKRMQGTGFELFSGFPARSMAVLALLLTVSICAVGMPLFYILPRIALSGHHRPPAQPQLISGFSETVELGALGTIKESAAPVMKVKVDAPVSKLPADLKWRGIAFDHFDGRLWSRSRPARNRIATQAGYFKLRQTTQGTDVLVQTVFLEPIATDVVFGSHRMLAVSSDLGWLESDTSDNVFSLTQRVSAVRYTVVSDITRPDPKLIGAYSVSPPADMQSCCLELPRRDQRIAELARKVTATAASPYGKARALEAYLRTAYGYSLELKGTPESGSPLSMFLFDVRRGHCEYFATAMAVMLRELGIPSRLINGFQAGDYNRLSDHWTVRQRHAHSWVEAYLAPYGWVEFDPTPAEPESTRLAFWKALENLFDALDLWWSAEVVNYDFRKQAQLFEAGRAALLAIQRGWWNLARASGDRIGTLLGILQTGPDRSNPAMVLIFLAVALGLAAIPFLRRPDRLKRRFGLLFSRAGFGRSRGAVMVTFYAEALDLLKRRGHQKPGNQTPLEFAQDLAQEPFGAALISLTAMYYRVRFGGQARQGDLLQVRNLLRTMRRRQN